MRQLIAYLFNVIDGAQTKVLGVFYGGIWPRCLYSLNAIKSIR